VIVYRHPGLEGLEIWQGLSRHATLHQLHHDKPAYFAALNDFLHRLRDGAAASAAGDPLDAAAGFDGLLLTGGDALAASPSITLPHRVASPGPFAARAGAEAVWREFGWRHPVAIDLGQSRLKAYTPQTNRIVERDPALLPFGANALDLPLARRRLRHFVAQALPASFDGAVLAIPCRLSANGDAEPCTYPGLSGAMAPLFAELFGGAPWVLMNDAVLAARGFPPPPGRKLLTVTLGFGAGAAVWDNRR
jgi:hypothetical protein